MYTRCFQVLDKITVPQFGTIYADIYNDEKSIRAAGYTKTCVNDKYGYPVWKNSDSNRPYYHQEFALLLPIRV